jgi:hypothetical protein
VRASARCSCCQTRASLSVCARVCVCAHLARSLARSGKRPLRQALPAHTLLGTLVLQPLPSSLADADAAAELAALAVAVDVASGALCDASPVCRSHARAHTAAVLRAGAPPVDGDADTALVVPRRESRAALRPTFVEVRSVVWVCHGDAHTCAVGARLGAAHADVHTERDDTHVIDVTQRGRCCGLARACMCTRVRVL